MASWLLFWSAFREKVAPRCAALRRAKLCCAADALTPTVHHNLLVTTSSPAA